jgi:hypothetical protein
MNQSRYSIAEFVGKALHGDARQRTCGLACFFETPGSTIAVAFVLTKKSMAFFFLFSDEALPAKALAQALTRPAFAVCAAPLGPVE